MFPQDILGFLVEDGRRDERHARTSERRRARRSGAEHKRHWFS